MSTGLLSIGITGIRAAQLGLLSTEHNVVNANTPGYSRQRTIQETNIALTTGSGSIGQGVNVQTINRMYDKYLNAQVDSATAKLSEIDAYYTQIKGIDSLLADPSAGLSPALQDFFSGVQQVAANPSLLSSRQSMISSAETLVLRFQSIDNRLKEMYNEVNGKITDAVSAVNSYAAQIAELNQRIILAESSYGQPANDLLDQRDYLVNELNKLIKVSTTTNNDGSFNVYIGTGQQIVVGARAMTMTARASIADESKIVVGLETANGGSLELPEKLIVGGELGGLVGFRSETLERARNELGRIAATVALTFNAQHALGQDMLGQANGDAGFNSDFFLATYAGPAVLVNSQNRQDGNPVVTVGFAPPAYGPNVTDGNFFTKLTTSDYVLTNTGVNQYNLVRVNDGKLIAAGDPADNDFITKLADEGLTLNITGLDAVGNSYLIQPTRNAAANMAVNRAIASDSRMLAIALPFRTVAAEGNTGNGSISLGTAAPGFDVSTLAAGPLSLTFATDIPVGAPTGSIGSLTFSGLTPGQMLIYRMPGGQEVAVTVTESGLPPVTDPVIIPYAQGMRVSLGGMTFEMNGVPNANDAFSLERNTGATADGRNGLAMALLQTQNTMAGGRATMQGVYAEMVANNGIKTRELGVIGKAQQAVLDQSIANRDALSGVNLDEEAANMLRFQQAYQASAKLLEVGKNLFDTLIRIGS